jgi:hypothetical protein
LKLFLLASLLLSCELNQLSSSSVASLFSHKSAMAEKVGRQIQECSSLIGLVRLLIEDMNTIDERVSELHQHVSLCIGALHSAKDALLVNVSTLESVQSASIFKSMQSNQDVSDMCHTMQQMMRK